ncbi:hybrid sensor histidine kinase/response regulator [Stutzerimonas kirkiae]|uniref:hybrid sensor histidine kinase/response regulator n=1 Tax=Stutzerimonas kirkiae TaxID=2211392 RepID=UPI001038308F|nr:CHASE domain-containing protein [Stutzerimonas kirkiae]TBV07220.1 hybrid sensor histidine kinase/response regulator [Stutzerimonas kirkiae]
MSLSPPSTIRQLLSRRNGIAWLVLLLSLLVQFITLLHLHRNESRAASQQFDILTVKASEAIRHRLLSHERALHGAAGLLAALGEPSQRQWREYVRNLQLQSQYPGTRQLGYAPVIGARDRAAHEARMRSELAADYRVHPQSGHRVHIPASHVEPLTKQAPVGPGYDMFSHDLLRRTMQRAARENEPRMVGTAGPGMQDEQPALLLYLPVYHGGLAPDTSSQRLQALRGFVYSSHHIDHLLQGIPDLIDHQLALEIHTSQGDGPSSPLYSNRDEASHDRAPRYSRQLPLDLYGQNWDLRLQSEPPFEKRFHSNEPLLAALGIGLSLTLFFYASSLGARNNRAEHLEQMTEHIQRNKQALRLSEERLSLALKGSNDGLWDLNLEVGTFYASTRAWQMLGYRPGELEPPPSLWQRLMEPDERQQSKIRLAQLMSSNTEYFATEQHLMHKSGMLVPVLLRGYILRDQDNRPLRISGTLMDLTERKQSERLKNEFIATLNHELRTPLASISGALGLINGGSLGPVPATLQQMLDIAQRNSQRLGHLIDDLLDMDKIAAGKMVFDFHAQPLPRLLEDALTSNQAYATEHDVRLLPAGTPDVRLWVDYSRLQQVLGNFLSNAIKHTPPGKCVWIGARLRDGHARIEVEDQGPGITQEFSPRVFEKFAQAGAPGNRNKGGTGLGLSISKELIERMGGRIGFDSPAGLGATFWCELPLHQQNGNDHQPGSPRLLVVEDEPDTGRMLHIMLHEAGYTVDRVQNLGLARERLAQTTYKAMTLDMHLPDGSGQQLIEEIRGTPGTKALPIIVISASHDADRAELPGVQWLHKPVFSAQLLNTLQQLVDKA